MGEWYSVDLFKQAKVIDMRPNQPIDMSKYFSHTNIGCICSFKVCVPKKLNWDGNIEIQKNEYIFTFIVDETTIDVTSSIIQVLFLGGDYDQLDYEI